MASAIASKAIEASTDNSEALKAYQTMDSAAMDALKAFPGALNQKEYGFVQDRLVKFCDAMDWENKYHDVRKFMVFSSEQLSGIRYELTAHNADARKVAAIDRLISIEADIYDRYSDGGECTGCAKEGIMAHDTWNEIFGS
jgi:hypothetical protein